MQDYRSLRGNWYTEVVSCAVPSPFFLYFVLPFYSKAELAWSACTKALLKATKCVRSHVTPAGEPFLLVHLIFLFVTAPSRPAHSRQNIIQSAPALTRQHRIVVPPGSGGAARAGQPLTSPDLTVITGDVTKFVLPPSSHCVRPAILEYTRPPPHRRA